MKIGIDGNPLTTPFPCGTKSYAQNLLENLARIDKKNEYVIFATKKVEIPNQKNFRLVKLPNLFPVLKKQFLIPFFVKKERVDVFHNLEPYGSIFLNHPKIITTVHDLRLNTTYPFLSKYLLNRLSYELTRKLVFKKSIRLLTGSKTTKKELSGLLSNKKDLKIDAVYNGYNKRFINYKNIKNKNAILCMGDFALRKNIPRIMEVYSNLPKGIRNKHMLKIIASTNEAGDNFLKLAHKYKIRKFIKIYTAVSDSRLIELYNNSFVFIYPSLYEGFGIPILEAMACGCPVITSNYGAMKEIAGNSAYLVNPKSTTQISNAIQKIINSPKLKNKLKREGLALAKMFSWEKTAKKTLELYNEV